MTDFHVASVGHRAPLVSAINFRANFGHHHKPTKLALTARPSTPIGLSTVTSIAQFPSFAVMSCPNPCPSVDHQHARCASQACMHGNIDAASQLLRRGADVGAKNERGSTPLHWAASRGHTQVLVHPADGM